MTILIADDDRVLPDARTTVASMGADEFLGKPPNFERFGAILQARLSTEQVGDANQFMKAATL
jgi:hypothetical protein